jgi:hypothetical protein
VGVFFLIYIGVPYPVEDEIEEDGVTVLPFFPELKQWCQLYDSLGELWNDGFENRIVSWV